MEDFLKNLEISAHLGIFYNCILNLYKIELRWTKFFNTIIYINIVFSHNMDFGVLKCT